MALGGADSPLLELAYSRVRPRPRGLCRLEFLLDAHDELRSTAEPAVERLHAFDVGVGVEPALGVQHEVAEEVGALDRLRQPIVRVDDVRVSPRDELLRRR